MNLSGKGLRLNGFARLPKGRTARSPTITEQDGTMTGIAPEAVCETAGTWGYFTGSGHSFERRMNSTTSFSPSANFEKSSL